MLDGVLWKGNDLYRQLYTTDLEGTDITFLTLDQLPHKATFNGLDFNIQYGKRERSHVFYEDLHTSKKLVVTLKRLF